MKKSFALFGAILTMFTVIPTVAAAVQYPDGGVWIQIMELFLITITAVSTIVRQ